MRLLAIGDIHGCSRALDTLLAAVAPQPDDWLVAVGDFVDRGPDSRGVLDRMVELLKTGRLVPIRGNHEQMMVDAREGLEPFLFWQQTGGQATLDSYRLHAGPEVFDTMPDEHWKFLEEDCLDWFESERHFFVHAGADPNLPIHMQPEQLLRWEKFHAPRAHRSGKIMVCGHTPQASGWPLNLGHAICIDTWVYDPRGWLTCLDVNSGDVWQANELGQTRSGLLHLPPRG